MTSFLNRFKPNAGPTSPASNSPPAKKDPNAPQPTPLEKLLADAGPIRADGSDKFFGFENFGSTCYANSVIQCLFYSAAFREHVINFPTRSPPEALERPSLPRLNTDLGLANGQNGALSPAKGRTSVSSPTQASPRKPALSPAGAVTAAGTKPEDNKDSPEYKKKMAIANGPVLNMDYENSKAYGMTESLFTSLKDIFEAVIAHRSRMGVVSPNKFLEILRRENEMFRTPMHQDAHEFLNYLLNEVVENVEQFSKQRRAESESGTGHSEDNTNSSLSTGGSPDMASNLSLYNTGWVHELFEGTLTSETRCLTCENTSQRDEVFLDLSVDLDQHSSVTSCLRKFSEEEMLCERNKFHCDNCGGLQEAEKRMKIKRLPKILALHLKRFKYTEDLQRLQKLFHRVVYPYYLRLFNTTDDAEDPDRLYELYAVVVHIGGGPYHGHYVSIIKTQDRGWLLFDDEMVEPVDKAYVRNFFGGDNVLACAYVLFYQETTFEAMQKEQEAEGLAAANKASEVANDTITLSAKSNGVLNGHPLQQMSPSVAEEAEQFANLDHAVTAPPIPTADHPSLQNTVTSPTLPKLSPKKSRIQLQFRKEKTGEEKERKAEEKERRAKEKELEKQNKQKQKEAELKRRETFRRQEEELKAALEASRATKTEEDKRRHKAEKQLAKELPKVPEQEEVKDEKDKLREKEQDKIKEKEPDKDKEAQGRSSMNLSALHRFRHSSMSLRHKPKFWSRDKDKHDADEPEVPSRPTTHTNESESTAVEPITTNSDKPEKHEKEKMKNRFSLGRKKSNILF